MLYKPAWYRVACGKTTVARRNWSFEHFGFTCPKPWQVEKTKFFFLRDFASPSWTFPTFGLKMGYDFMTFELDAYSESFSKLFKQFGESQSDKRHGAFPLCLSRYISYNIHQSFIYTYLILYIILLSYSVIYTNIYIYIDLYHSWVGAISPLRCSTDPSQDSARWPSRSSVKENRSKVKGGVRSGRGQPPVGCKICKGLHIP